MTTRWTPAGAAASSTAARGRRPLSAGISPGPGAVARSPRRTALSGAAGGEAPTRGAESRGLWGPAARGGVEEAARRAVVVGVVGVQLVLVDRAVVGEVQPRADRHPLAAGDAVDAQHVDVGVDRVQVALGILADLPRAVGEVEAVVG